MNIFLITLWILSGGATIAVYLLYAYANYPKSWRWELLLIGSSFVCGCISGVFILVKDFRGIAFALGVLLSGCAFAIVFRFFFLDSVRRGIPKRASPASKDDR